MLPDLESMAGQRFPVAPAGPLADGVRFHHLTDGVFHRAPAFAALSARGLAELSTLGLGRGPARAVAHIGVELLLDGALSDARVDGSGAARQAYRDALVAAHSVLQDGPAPGLASGLASGLAPGLAPGLASRLASSDKGRDGRHFAALLARLEDAPIPEAYRDPGFVTERLSRLLSRRPRLALAPGQADAVRTWLTRVQPAVQAAHADLLEQVHQGLHWPEASQP